MTERVFNFSPGPAVLPLTVLQQAQRDLVSLPGVGMSIMEISHRSKCFEGILADTKASLSRLLGIPDDYTILFLQGGSSLQFSMLPMNLLGGGESADYVITGTWSTKALEEAGKLGKTNVAWDGKEGNYNRLPGASELKLDSKAAYTYYCSNETIQGVQFPAEPIHGNGPLICDASSDFMCRPTPIAKHGIVFACAQKNAGISGVTVVIMRKDLLERGPKNLPSMLDYRLLAKNDSLYNTPPTFAIYILKLVTDWLEKDIGGLAKMEALNQRKAKLLYDVLDNHPKFYSGHAAPAARSLMNVTFRMPSEELETAFVKEAKEQQLMDLKGHRSVGGIRASIYNAMPLKGAEALQQFMLDFVKKKG
jgi:phosphoserine aminotransferase